MSRGRGLAVALAAAAPATAAAAPSAVADLGAAQRLPGGVRSEVAVSGTSLVWTEQNRRGDLRVRSIAPGARARTLLSRRSPRNEASPSTQLDAGPARAALWLHAYHGNFTGEVAETFGAALAGGPVDRPLPVLLGALRRPLPERVADEEGGVAVAGDLALTISSRHEGGEFSDARLVAHDLRIPARRLRRVRPGHLDVEVAARDAAGLCERDRARTRYAPRRRAD